MNPFDWIDLIVNVGNLSDIDSRKIKLRQNLLLFVSILLALSSLFIMPDNAFGNLNLTKALLMVLISFFIMVIVSFILFKFKILIELSLSVFGFYAVLTMMFYFSVIIFMFNN